MKNITSKSSLAIALSQLKSFEVPKVRLEQYPTPSELCAEILWLSYLKRDLSHSVADFGCGNGIFGLGALLLGCPHVNFIESEPSILEICKKNYKLIVEMYGKSSHFGKVSFLEGDISEFSKKVKTVIQNPPFGTKEKHIDKAFLEKAMSCADVVYTVHKASTKNFIDHFIDGKGFIITDYWESAFPLKAAFKFHKKPVKKIDVGIWRAQKA